MLNWLFALLASLFSLTGPAQTDYVGDVAARAAYSSLLVSSAPVKPKVPTKDCTTCNGTGRIRSGDGLAWLKCPDCDGNVVNKAEEVQPAETEKPEESVKIPKSDPNRYIPGDTTSRRVIEN